MKSYADRIAVVTGAASGIGQALAIGLARRGCHVAISDLNLDGLAQTAEQVSKFGVRCMMSRLDVADRAAWPRYAEDVGTQFDAVHLVFNVAGVALVDRAATVSLDDFHWLMDINFWGVVYGTRAFLPRLLEADEAHIVNVSSLFGLMSAPMSSTYNASKFAVKGFTDALKMEMAGTPVRVSCVLPGGVKTGIIDHSKFGEQVVDIAREDLAAEFEARARLTATEAAEIILAGVRKNRRRILVGTDAKLLDFIVRLFPGSYETLLRIEKDVIRRRAAREAS